MKKVFYKTSFYIVIVVFTIFLIIVAAYGARMPQKSKDCIHITEVCIKNDVNAHDDCGRYGADYVELYNSSNDEIDLSGYYLSDDASNIRKCELNGVSIRPEETVIVWSSPSGDDETCRDSYVSRDVYQTFFALSGGEKVILSKDDEVVDYVRIPQHISEGKVYACLKNDYDNYSVMNPSPYEVMESYEEYRINPAINPSFSVESGWYSEPFYLELSCKSGTIYYTTDGSEPDENSEEYTGGIFIKDRSDEENIYANIGQISITNDYLPDTPIDKGTIVKAVVIKNGVRSQTVSRTYFVGLSDKLAYKDLPVMEITVDPEALFDNYNGIYVKGNVYDVYAAKYDVTDLPFMVLNAHMNYSQEDRGWERLANIEYFDNNHEYVFGQTIGIRIHGGWSTSFNQKSFNLYAREEYDGNDAFLYGFFGKTYNKLMLRSGGYRDTYYTKMRDVLNQKLVEDRLIGTQKGMPCVVFINGEYWGLYNLQENIGSSYVAENYGVDYDNIAIIKNGTPNIMGDVVNSYSELTEYALNNDLKNDDNYRYIERNIDIQSYIDYMAFEIYVANCDSIGNNYSHWRTIVPKKGEYGDCKWRYLIYDTDDSAGMVVNLSQAHTNSFIDGHWSVTPLGEYGDPFFGALIQNEEFKQRFVTTFMDLANNNFRYERVSEVISEMADEYRYGVIASQNRFRGQYKAPDYSVNELYDGVYDETLFDADVQVIDDFYRDRYQYIVEYMKEELQLNGELHELTLYISDPDNCNVALNTIANVEHGLTWKYYSDYPITLKCEPEDGYRFIGWTDETGTIISEDPELSMTLENNQIIIARIEAN